LLDTYEISLEHSKNKKERNLIKYIKDEVSTKNHKPLLNLRNDPRVYKLDFINNDNHIQVMIGQNYPTIESCIYDFDFTICQFGFDGNDIYYFDNSINDLQQKIIKLAKIKNNRFIYFERIIKFLNRGYKLDKESYEFIIKSQPSLEYLQETGRALDCDFFKYINSKNLSETLLKNKISLLHLDGMLNTTNLI